MAIDLAGYLTGTRTWPGMPGPTGRPDKPLVIQNMLTNQLWEYNTAAAAMGADGVFDFNWLPPGVYTIRNFADAALPVLLFNHTYNVEVGQEWRFVAHDEVGSHAGPLAGASGRWFDGNDARLTQSYWDRALGGSIWDNGASVWDLINS